jgi:hypothetical protein
MPQAKLQRQHCAVCFVNKAFPTHSYIDNVRCSLFLLKLCLKHSFFCICSRCFWNGKLCVRHSFMGIKIHHALSLKLCLKHSFMWISDCLFPVANLCRRLSFSDSIVQPALSFKLCLWNCFMLIASCLFCVTKFCFWKNLITTAVCKKLTLKCYCNCSLLVATTQRCR